MFSQPGKNDCQPTLIHVIHLRVFFFLQVSACISFLFRISCKRIYFDTARFAHTWAVPNVPDRQTRKG